MASSVDRNRKYFPERIFFNSCNTQGNVQAFRLTGLLWWQKTDLTFPAFSLRFVDFTVLFCFRCKFSISFRDKRPLDSSVTVAWFFWTNHNSLLHTATNEIASFCIDNRLRQMAFFVFTKVSKGRVTHSAIASCATFLFLPHVDVICDLLLNRRTATWNLFVNWNTIMSETKCIFWREMWSREIRAHSPSRPDKREVHWRGWYLHLLNNQTI